MVLVACLSWNVSFEREIQVTDLSMQKNNLGGKIGGWEETYLIDNFLFLPD